MTEFCEYCLGDFNHLPPVYVHGYRDLPAHRPEDKDTNDCAYWLEWQEYGRWETGRGMQGARKWPDGREWEPEGAAENWTKDYGTE